MKFVYKIIFQKGKNGIIFGLLVYCLPGTKLQISGGKLSANEELTTSELHSLVEHGILVEKLYNSYGIWLNYKMLLTYTLASKQDDNVLVTVFFITSCIDFISP